jgi:hypothetical protein
MCGLKTAMAFLVGWGRTGPGRFQRQKNQTNERRRSSRPKLLTKDEARRIAANVAKAERRGRAEDGRHVAPLPVRRPLNRVCAPFLEDQRYSLLGGELLALPSGSEAHDPHRHIDFCQYDLSPACVLKRHSPP